MQDTKIDMKNMTVLQKHVRFRCDAIGCKRSFQFSEYGDKDTSLKAASEFEKCCKNIVYDFDATHGFPKLRYELLEAHGFGKLLNKKTMRVQREALVEALSSGSSPAMETTFLANTVAQLIDPDLASRSSVHQKGLSFIATFSGSVQKMEQTFKTLKAATEWILVLDKADKD